VVVIPFEGAVQAGIRAPDAAQRVALAERCAASGAPVSSLTGVPALRSGMKDAASRPGHGAYVSTSPVLEPLAAESLRPWGNARYDSELISIRREAVRLNSSASLPCAAR